MDSRLIGTIALGISLVIAMMTIAIMYIRGLNVPTQLWVYVSAAGGILLPSPAWPAKKDNPNG